ncbi:MAG: hypothetical protein WCH65_08455 [bacterium]
MDLAKSMYESIYATSTNAYSALQNSIAGVDLTQNMIDGFTNDVSSDSSKAKSTLSAILNSKNTITKL